MERPRFPPLLHPSCATLDCTSSSGSSPSLSLESRFICAHHIAPRCNPMDMSQGRLGTHFLFIRHKHPLTFRVNGLYWSIHSCICPVEVARGKEVCLPKMGHPTVISGVEVVCEVTTWRRHLPAACSQKTYDPEARCGEWITPLES